MFKDFDPSTRLTLREEIKNVENLLTSNKTWKTLIKHTQNIWKEKKLDVKEQSLVGLHYCISTIV
jgi:hypothetical protein